MPQWRKYLNYTLLNGVKNRVIKWRFGRFWNKNRNTDYDFSPHYIWVDNNVSEYMLVSIWERFSKGTLKSLQKCLHLLYMTLTCSVWMLSPLLKFLELYTKSYKLPKPIFMTLEDSQGYFNAADFNCCLSIILSSLSIRDILYLAAIPSRNILQVSSRSSSNLESSWNLINFTAISMQGNFSHTVRFKVASYSASYSAIWQTVTK